MVDELAIARSQPAVQAREALLTRLYGKHPYAVELPIAEALEDVTAKQLRTLHEPDGVARRGGAHPGR